MRWRRRPLCAPALCALVGALLYANSLSNPFVFDDHGAIVENADIRRILPLWTAPAESAHTALNARPTVRLSLALNHAAHGLDVRGYHAVNILLHVLCALALCGVVRRTLALPALAPRYGAHAPELALGCALVWLAHPLNNQVCNYLVQRSEPLMALGYLGALYGLARGADDRRWQGAAVLACACGMASKETAASAPLIALLYDRTFLAGSFGGALRARRGLYAGLAACWLVPAALLATRPHGDSIGFAAGSWNYLLNQCAVVADYLGKVFWPDPLVFDYGFPLALAPGDVWPQALLLLGLLALTGWALYRRAPAGFCLALFFAALAPTSSLVPIANEVGAERRMYLPLAALTALILPALYAAGGRRGLAAALGLAVAALGLKTVDRNRDFRTPMAVARAIVDAVPHNPRGHTYLGLAYVKEGRVQEAIGHYRRAIALRPTFGEAHNNLGIALGRLGRHAEAIPHYHTALAHHPGLIQAYNNLGNALMSLGRHEEAARHYRQAIARKPDYADAYNNLGIALAAAGRPAEALAHFRRALEIRPDFQEARKNIEIARRANASDPR